MTNFKSCLESGRKLTIYLKLYNSPTSKTSREVAHLTERKNLHTPYIDRVWLKNQLAKILQEIDITDNRQFTFVYLLGQLDYSLYGQRTSMVNTHFL